MEYSPINNVQKGKKYPACLLTGGLNDPRVQYWEPAKFAAEIRHQHDEDKSGPVCLKIDMVRSQTAISSIIIQECFHFELAFFKVKIYLSLNIPPHLVFYKNTLGHP